MNRISKFEDGTFDTLRDLIKLSAYKNKISNIQENRLFVNCKKLTGLSLEENEIKKLDKIIGPDMLKFVGIQRYRYNILCGFL
jgi:hypothetical protein